jgi:aryl-alcohol dehydrogenase-like predicted oxidoreductase
VTDPAALARGLDASLKRLRRERLDLVLLHPNELSVEEARPVFDWLEEERDRDRIAAFGWSTDFPEKARAFADRTGFRAVELAANLFFRADRLLPEVRKLGLCPLIRSPLAMGLLAGRIGPDTRFGEKDVRSADRTAIGYFEDGRPNPEHLARIAAVREHLTSGGRSLAQGAIAWLWALSPGVIPVPGLRTPEQVLDLAGALERGPLDRDTFEAVEHLIVRPPEGPPQPR